MYFRCARTTTRPPSAAAPSPHHPTWAGAALTSKFLISHSDRYGISALTLINGASDSFLICSLIQESNTIISQIMDILFVKLLLSGWVFFCSISFKILCNMVLCINQQVRYCLMRGDSGQGSREWTVYPAEEIVTSNKNLFTMVLSRWPLKESECFEKTLAEELH